LRHGHFLFHHLGLSWVFWLKAATFAGQNQISTAVQLPALSKIPMDLQTTITQGLALPLMEAFYTVQGEGTHSGTPAYFIRLGGCDVGCVWCDVKDSWDAGRWPVIDIQDIVDGALEYPGRMVVITGGEPLLYDLFPLTALLKEKGFVIHIETSGAHPFSGHFDWVCFSPKKFKAPHPSIYAHADELKVVVYNKSDFAFAEKHTALVRPTCKRLLQPEWDKSVLMLNQVIEYVKNHPDWKISLQTHKFMAIP
jgi:7-carboxy-7-deazaguanine synthase